MKHAAEENGRRKVQMLLEARRAASGHDQLEGIDKEIQDMSYEHFASVRNSLMQIYPKLDNPYDRKLQYYTLDNWKAEAEVFQRELKSDGYSTLPPAFSAPKVNQKISSDGEKIHLLDFNDGKRENYNTHGV